MPRIDERERTLTLRAGFEYKPPAALGRKEVVIHERLDPLLVLVSVAVGGSPTRPASAAFRLRMACRVAAIASGLSRLTFVVRRAARQPEPGCGSDSRFATRLVCNRSQTAGPLLEARKPGGVQEAERSLLAD